MTRPCILFLLTFLCNSAFLFSQNEEDTSMFYGDEINTVKIHRANSTYNFYLKRVQKLYPYALYAANVLEELDNELAELDKKRQIKKTSKERQKELFDEFNYMIRDLYQSEGKLLMKLINRETGMTVDEIIRKYRNNFQAGIYNTMATLFSQDLKIKYDPKGEDKLIEKIIQDIKNESVFFDETYKKVTKEEYKEGMKVYRADKKESRKNKHKNNSN
jgi:hypothetical protein